MKLTRKEFLFGVGGAALAAPLGAAGHYAYSRPRPQPAPQGLTSFAQSGEDLVVHYICKHVGIKGLTYLDVGAHDPVVNSNTYFFYLRGHRGVLVEPNPAMCEKLREARPHDKVLVAGIGAKAAREADYYVMNDSSRNTFSKENAEHQERTTKGGIHVVEVRKMPLLDVNEVMAEHFEGPPTFVSIDVEGLDLAILQSMNFRRYRPKIICVEVLVSDTNRTVPEIATFMHKQGYVARGGSFVNTIFVDGKIL